jgi:hypothetical protein
MKISEEQLFFLKKHNIPISKIFDAANQKREIYRSSMKALDKLVAINTKPCTKYGHTIRTRNGHCCQCNTASIAYIKRHYANGYVYIVGSQEKKVLKVGSTNNIKNRVNSLNFENYASINDWELILYYKCNNIGLIESEAHNKLNKFQIEKTYTKNGRTQIAYEIFDCSYDICKNSLISSIKDQKDIIEKYEDELLSKKYFFNKNKKQPKVISNLTLENKINLFQKKKEIINKKKTKKIIEKNKSIKENLNNNYYNNKDNFVESEKNNRDAFTNIYSFLILISLCISIVFFVIFLTKFPYNILFLISSIFFGYLMQYVKE